MERARSDDRGQALPLVLVALILAGLLGAGVVRVAAAAARRSAAQAAADAAALAGVTAGRGGAAHAAAANGAALRSYREDGDEVVVAVERRGAVASARARWSPDPPTWGTGGEGPAPIP
jgi:Tfp pilus assembly protein PilX